MRVAFGFFLCASLIAVLSPSASAEAVYFANSGGDRSTIMRFDRIDRSANGTYEYLARANMSTTTTRATSRIFPFHASITGDHVVLTFISIGANCKPWVGRFRHNFNVVRFGPLAFIIEPGKTIYQAGRIPSSQVGEIVSINEQVARESVGHALTRYLFQNDPIYPQCRPRASMRK